MWNSSTFNPVAPPSECHVDFQTAIDCSYEQVKSLAEATPEKVEDIFISMRSHLLPIITRWEQSGQGEGGMDNDIDGTDEGNEEDNAVAAIPDSADDCHDKMIGSLSGRPARALQSRAAFLNGRPSYLLYFWEIADTHQVLQSSLQRLNKTTGASDASCAPSTTSSSSGTRDRQRRRQEGIDEDKQVLHPLVRSITELVDLQRQYHERQLNSLNEGLEFEERRRVSERRSQSSDRQFQRRAELLDLARKYRRLNAELDPNADQKSKRLSDFYVSECSEIEKEIFLLDRSSDDNVDS